MSFFDVTLGIFDLSFIIISVVLMILVFYTLPNLRKEIEDIGSTLKEIKDIEANLSNKRY